MYKKIITISFIIPVLTVLLILIVSDQTFSQKDWDQQYNELLETILSQMEEPTGDAGAIFEENLRWLDVKGEVRNRVEASLQELNRLSYDDPDNEELNQWVQKYYDLIQDAELSGSNTVFNACWRFLRLEERYGSLYWDIALWRVREFGRPLYVKASKNKFKTDCIIDRAKCLLNFAVGDVEDNPYGLGLYWGRKLVFCELDEEGNINTPNRDFNVICERRGDFIMTEEGEPWVKADIGLQYVDLIREECLWWKFSDQYNDATDLMNQYYKDVLCKKPPHLYNMGHKWFLDLAEEYGLEKSVEYNKGFYGTVHGIVEILENGKRKPAPGAEVIINDFGQNWMTTADQDGIYKIEGAILHADCSPFDISATYKGDRTDDTYNGYLTEPDNSAELLKDLLIERSRDWEWSGKMTIERIERFNCELDESKEGITKSMKINDLSTTRATVSINAENIDDSPPGFNITMGENLTVSGFMKCEIRNDEERYANDYKPPSTYTSYHKETLVGEDLFNLSHKNLNLMFMSNLEDIQKDGSLEEMSKMLESGNIDQAKLEAFGKKFEESMGTGDEGTSKITVIMQLFGDCNCKAVLTQSSWGVTNGERKDTSTSTTLNMAIGGGVGLDFIADYVRKKDGSATITGSYSKITPIEGGQREGCPPKTETITCTLNLSKSPKK